MKQKYLIAAVFFFAFAAYGVFRWETSRTKKDQPDIQLCDHCPPGFELTKDNKCVLVNFYQQYQSMRNTGVGGLQTSLPQVRDGFSPQQIDLGRYLFFDPVLS